MPSTSDRLYELSHRLNTVFRGLHLATVGIRADARPDHPVIATVLAMQKDGDMDAAIRVVGGYLDDLPDPPKVAIRVVEVLARVINLAAITAPNHAPASCAAIDAARAAKDFAKADALRKELMDAGYEVKTTKEGTTARRRLA